MKRTTVANVAVTAAATPMVAPDVRCGTCRHCKGQYVGEGDAGPGDITVKGKCYRYPPAMMFRPYAGSGAGPVSVRPTVSGDDAGCGEWKA